MVKSAAKAASILPAVRSAASSTVPSASSATLTPARPACAVRLARQLHAARQADMARDTPVNAWKPGDPIVFGASSQQRAQNQRRASPSSGQQSGILQVAGTSNNPGAAMKQQPIPAEWSASSWKPGMAIDFEKQLAQNKAIPAKRAVMQPIKPAQPVSQYVVSQSYQGKDTLTHRTDRISDNISLQSMPSSGETTQARKRKSHHPVKFGILLIVLQQNRQLRCHQERRYLH